MKRQPTELERKFVNDATDKGLTSKINKQLMQLNLKKKRLKKKMGRRSKFLQRRHTDGQRTQDKMFTIANQKTANQNYSKRSPHTSQNSHHQEVYKQ